MNSSGYQFETGMYRPPSEGGSASLLVRFTRNCPWNQCTFCAMYKTEKFQLRPVDEIKADIDAMAALAGDLKSESIRLGGNGRVTREAILALVDRCPELNYHQGADMFIQWLLAGGKTAFIQDGNSLIMPPDDLIEVLSYLKASFPSIDRITTYARARTIAQRSPETLQAIRAAGLDRVHLGLETGDDELLRRIKKGVDSQGHVTGGQKAMAAGFQVSEYWMPGLGGKEMSRQHALNTARVLNEVNPHYIRSRPFRPIPGTPIHDQVKAGETILLSPKEQLQELKLMISALEVTSKVCFDHAGNYWRTSKGDLVFSHGYEGYQFPDEKDLVLERIEQGLAFDRQQEKFIRL
ncbi:radical SAM protein [Desulforhopalus singaporensis]|uniref:Radical SAM superfamily protein n=1 Tax=Desulforhopalus singaporensis TaxID=91360 RepID=A0A1H0Q4D9_9BACT|nr:radical SAM protein [Desulforhopalus singaporensis]SDP12184.1 Radical SAM superfamily protein [Desulforhopalus singaporensis]